VPKRAPPLIPFSVAQVLPHDPRAFTQGLDVHDGRLFEGTGLYGLSALRELDGAGNVLRSARLPGYAFGEGIAVHGGAVTQLTWRERKAFVYDLETFERLRTLEFATDTGEGWGLCRMGGDLVMSDGSDALYFCDPETLRERRRVKVHYEGTPLRYLNDLCAVGDSLYANVLGSKSLWRIDPGGEVLGRVDLSPLAHPAGPMNGVARDGCRLLVTGKRWPSLYALELPGAA